MNIAPVVYIDMRVDELMAAAKANAKQNENKLFRKY